MPAGALFLPACCPRLNCSAAPLRPGPSRAAADASFFTLSKRKGLPASFRAQDGYDRRDFRTNNKLTADEDRGRLGS